MTIKEVEERTGLARSNVRFYEKEKLIVPSRNESNGYRDYSEKDVEDIKRIAYLRTLGISVEDIRNIIAGKRALHEAVKEQSKALEGQIADLHRAKALCERMLCEEDIRYEELQVERYVTGLQDYWNDNRPVLKPDSVSFLCLWGSFAAWAAIAALCLIIGILFYAKLPPQIPVQWSRGTAVSFADKGFIFAYPTACVAIRYLLRPCLYARLHINSFYGEMITEYLTGYLCFLALSVEVFSILFIYGAVKNVTAVLLTDTVMLIGPLIMGIMKTDFPVIKRKQ